MARSRITKESLLRRFQSRKRLTSSDVGKSSAALDALHQLLAEGNVKKVDAYYLAGFAPNEQSARRMIVQILCQKPKLFKQSAWSRKIPHAIARQAVESLIDEGEILRFEINGDKKSGFLYLHKSHVRPDNASSTKDEPDQRSHSTKIRESYQQLAARAGSRSIFISDLIRESGLTKEQVHEWLAAEVIQHGKGQLDEGDWASATDEQRAAAIELRSLPRLYVSLTL